RPLSGRHADLVRSINSLGAPILAIDIPSGLNADTGAVMGEAVRAAHTITFIGLKPGLLTLDGPDCCGALEVASIGLDAETLCAPEGRFLDPSILAGVLPHRPRNFHKGLAGNVGVLGGARGMIGAAILAGRAALSSGSGRVYLALLAEDAPQVDFLQPELMLRTPEFVLDAKDMNVIAAGPGMGQSEGAGRLLAQAIASPAALVLDADALNLLAANAALAEVLAGRAAPTLLTPHPAEAARLLGCSTREVQADRIAAARRIAGRYRSAVALKGNGTVIADAGGAWWINSSGNPGMASAGMGDALTGFIASLMAQGAPALEALLAGVFLHGAAGDAAAKRGPLGLTASDVIEQARSILNSALYPSP
ncbi:MAG: NAD(P)H-hydrate dehydratase, partial [Betaproteobacteria bacterium]|nr:NAD(P)H-hydrate dehydratase [Betaproteobacteria bacterium]